MTLEVAWVEIVSQCIACRLQGRVKRDNETFLVICTDVLPVCNASE